LMDGKDKVLQFGRREFLATSAIGLAGSSLGKTAWPLEAAAWNPAPSATNGTPSRVIIDTDPGTDDAFALLLAMRSPELKIEGITPVSGNVPLELTLPNALRMVEIAGRTDIPVAAGAKVPLVRRLVTAEYAHGNNGLAGTVFPEPKIKPVAEPATELIRRVVRAHPGEVTLITLGPLTNIAAALLADDQLAGMIKGLVMMGGSLSGGNITPSAEFNVYVDPEAARVVFQSGIPVTMVGLDVTRKTALTWEHVRALESSSDPVAQAAAKIARNTVEMDEKAGYAVAQKMHDSLAVAAFLDPSLLKFEKFYVDIETTGELTAGETLGYSPYAGDLRKTLEWEKQNGKLDMPIRGSAPLLGRTDISPVLRKHWVPNTNVALDVDFPRFFQLFLNRLTGKSS
jgi:inosine-uridine nucleoside N-ribohydrolase